jgi:hypothetical protein
VTANVGPGHYRRTAPAGKRWIDNSKDRPWSGLFSPKAIIIRGFMAAFDQPSVHPITVVATQGQHMKDHRPVYRSRRQA